MIFLLGLLILLFYCISETVISTWSPTFLRSTRNFDIRYASFSIAIYIISVLIGRAIIAVFAGKCRSNTIILFLSVLAFLSLLFFTFFKSTHASFISVFFVGLGFSGIITIGISSTSTVYEKGRGVLASIIFAVTNLGISIAPFLTGQASKYNMTLSVALAPIFKVADYKINICRIPFISIPQIKIHYPKIVFKSSSGVEIGFKLNFSTKTFKTFGDIKAGSVGPK
jgi:predicted MFS family arabinose efflux permease